MTGHFNYFLEKLNLEKEPFFSSIFSLSSPPYKIPSEFDNVFNKGKLNIHEKISYTDFVLGKFFRRALNKKNGIKIHYL